MASQADYTAGANALMHLIYTSIAKLPDWEQNFIPKDKIPAAAGAGAKAVIDAVDAYRAAQPPLSAARPNKRRRKK
jgi:hypothetical protein